MITTEFLPDGNVLVTFTLNDDRPVSVVGSFNDWDPSEHPLLEQFDGLRRTTLTIPADSRVNFRYLAADGVFFDDVDADCFEPNGLGGTHGVLDRSLSTSIDALT